MTNSTTKTSFIQVDVLHHREALIRINIEYMNWVMGGIQETFSVDVEDLLGMPLADYVPAALDKICGEGPPQGVYYLIEVDGQLAGMGGLRRLRADTAEIKRLYILPDFRGLQLGNSLLQQLLADARKFGYQQVFLDTAPFMKAAHHLYEAAGFTDCPAYAETEVPVALQPDWRFMSLVLNTH
ncbi:GNAT family N-acetyltransferase [Undibacterium sp. TS12]|uniref:GNAT family N-acetyltransferase n=1 Tax=Undibacterium sp. TS12 TaxID=2908202 RepID=UPI001F4CF40C|nr:GNAT family N-acetyltransferase [Undibacterium sp. TS12]MCH8617485.1 GNAT family N-acetyltransferase [Undibacterium sp. TS12]